MAAGGAVAAAALLLPWAPFEDRPEVVVPGVLLEGRDVAGMDRGDLEAIALELADEGLDRQVTLRGPGEVAIPTRARDLGATPAPDSAIEAALRHGHTGHPLRDLQERSDARRGLVDLAVGQQFREDVALELLQELAPEFERPSLPTRFDMEARRVLPAARGSTLMPHDTLSAIAVGLASGADEIEVVTTPSPPADDPLAELKGELDISVVLGRFTTPYSMAPNDKDRAHNLKIGAARLDGHVLLPGEEFSFNDVVGPRTTEAGFRYAPGITSGEIVDVVGGGICQVSSTVFGAVFFSGLEIVRARPHSRPSGYVDMGLDSTVVYGAVDMRFRNNFDFPVVFHVDVQGGKVAVELLGPRRPYRVAFEREIDEVLPYTTIVRNDDRLRSGTQTVAQQGKRGFKVTRRRKLYDGGTVVHSEEWTLSYPPTREIVRRGTNPGGAIPESKPEVTLRDPANELRIVQ
ncbi:MAG: VanW family protein [Myxococcales bacterium]|nr:VanW family protein [Myxococcales bacterium]MCB9752869.1 VanW family protein [Myxococcales bacterium]